MKTSAHLALLAAAGLALATTLAPGAPPAEFPIKASPDGRRLVTAAGAPVLVQADAAWSLIVALTREEAEIYLEDRQRRGFNAIIVNLLEHLFGGAANPHGAPCNRAGDAPFTTADDFTTPNEAYFAHADWVIDRAAAHGITVLLAPCYLGYPRLTEGWYDEVRRNGVAACRAYGRFVGARYHDRPNLIWVMAGDRDPDAARPMVEALAAGLRENDPVRLMTAHCQPGESPRMIFPDSPWLMLNNVYTYDPVHRNALYAYTAAPPMPFILFESAYENERGANPARLRFQAYSAILAGACGQAFGNSPIWKFGDGWRAALDSEGARSMTHASRLFRSRNWVELVPDATHVVVTEGYLGGDTWVGCARTRDGRTIIAYLPEKPARFAAAAADPVEAAKHAPTIDVDLTRLSGAQVRAWWFDPRNGTATEAGTFATDHTRTFTRPDDRDWVLVIDDAAALLPPPGFTGR